MILIVIIPRAGPPHSKFNVERSNVQCSSVPRRRGPTPRRPICHDAICHDAICYVLSAIAGFGRSQNRLPANYDGPIRNEALGLANLWTAPVFSGAFASIASILAKNPQMRFHITMASGKSRTASTTRGLTYFLFQYGVLIPSQPSMQKQVTNIFQECVTPYKASNMTPITC